MRFDHVTIVVKSIEKVAKFYKENFGFKEKEIVKIDFSGYKSRFLFLSFAEGNGYIELLEPGEEGPWIKRLEERGEGSLWILCFEVNDIEEYYDEMKKKGIALVDRFGKPLVGKKYLSVPTGERFAYLPREFTFGTWIEVLDRKFCK